VNTWGQHTHHKRIPLARRRGLLHSFKAGDRNHSFARDSYRRATPDWERALKSARRSGVALRSATGVDRRGLGVHMVGGEVGRFCTYPIFSCKRRNRQSACAGGATDRMILLRRNVKTVAIGNTNLSELLVAPFPVGEEAPKVRYKLEAQQCLLRRSPHETAGECHSCDPECRQHCPRAS